MPFQFHLRTLFKLILCASISLTWIVWLKPESDFSYWIPGLLGLTAGLGFAGALLHCNRKPQRAADIFWMAWLLVCFDIAYSSYEITVSGWCYLPRTSHAIWHGQSILRQCLTLPVMLIPPLLLMCPELTKRVFKSRLMRLLCMVTLCDSVLLVLMIRYLFTQYPLT